jgi:hypothetical protein
MEAVRENPQYKSDIEQLIADLVPKDAVKIDATFPPYWQCGLAKGFRGKVLLRDERDPKFVRYHIENTGPKPIECRKGAVADGVVEDVAPGRIFTIGAYATLPLDRFLGFEITVICTGERELPGNERSEGVPRNIFDFDIYATKEVEAKLASQRSEDLQFVAKLQREAQRKAFAEITRISAEKSIELNGARSFNLHV